MSKRFKFIITFLLVLHLPLSFVSSAVDGDEVEKIELQSSIPSGSISRSSNQCPIDCVYYCNRQEIAIRAVDADYYGTVIMVTNNLTGLIESSIIVYSYEMFETITIQNNGIYSIDIILTSGVRYHGILCNIFHSDESDE